MSVYLKLVMLLNFCVNLLLLLGTARLCSFPARFARIFAAAAVAGIYGGICLLPSFDFLGGTLWRMVILGILSAVAFGLDRGMLRRMLVFILLSMALGGISVGMQRKDFWSILAVAGVLVLLCSIAFRGGFGKRKYVQVTLHHGGAVCSMAALRDTGNLLRDPITGQPVLIVGQQVAKQLLGLSASQLLDPVGTVSSGIVPGLRLIPYRSVGQPCGMLVAIKPEQILIDEVQSGMIVAFAPGELGNGEEFQALTGGA